MEYTFSPWNRIRVSGILRNFAYKDMVDNKTRHLVGWGAMLSGGREYIRDYAYMTIFPGLAIMITILALNFLGDGLRDVLDPKLKR